MNDISTEIFQLQDARQLLEFASKTSWIAELSMWSVNRDNSVNGPLYKSSQITQNDFDFCNIFKGLESVAAPSPSPTVIPPKPVITTTSVVIPTKSGLCLIHAQFLTIQATPTATPTG